MYIDIVRLSSCTPCSDRAYAVELAIAQLTRL